MVPAAPENLCDISEKAQKLLEAGQSVKASVKLTRREEEVLENTYSRMCGVAGERFHLQRRAPRVPCRRACGAELYRGAGRRRLDALSIPISEPAL
jgi:hypothetical protein